MTKKEILEFLMRERVNGNKEFIPVSVIARKVKMDISNTSKCLIDIRDNFNIVENENWIARCSWRVKPEYLNYIDNEIIRKVEHGK